MKLLIMLRSEQSLSNRLCIEEDILSVDFKQISKHCRSYLISRALNGNRKVNLSYSTFLNLLIELESVLEHSDDDSSNVSRIIES